MRRTGALIFVLLALAPGLAAENRNFYLKDDMCVRCHLLGENLGAPNPVLAWQHSAHFRPDSGCADCHGGDKYLYADLQRGHLGLPDRAEAIDQCGKCHVRAASLSKDIRRDESSGARCSADCIDCHGYHEVDQAGLDLINEKNCGRCHEFRLAAPEARALEQTRARMAFLEDKIQRRHDLGVPVAGLRRELDDLKTEWTNMFHAKRADELGAAAASLDDSIEKLTGRLQGSPSYQWWLSGFLVIGFLLLVLALLTVYQSIIGSIDSGKEDHEMMADKKIAPRESGGGGELRPRSSGLAWLALLIAALALVLTIQSRRDTTDESIQALNQTVSTKLVPQMRKADDRAAKSSVYELKRMTVTLDEIRDNASDEEIKVQIDRIQQELDELAVKLMVRE